MGHQSARVANARGKTKQLWKANQHASCILYSYLMHALYVYCIAYMQNVIITLSEILQVHINIKRNTEHIIQRVMYCIISV